MSDGPWGIDASREGTDVSMYEVTSNTSDFETTDFAIERNVELRAITNSYVAAYRALTPRFKAVDVTDYNSFQFSAKGTGNLEITFVKESITNWEEQYKTTIALTNTLQEFSIDIADLQNNSTDTAELNDVVTIVFTMVAENGISTSKVMNINQLRFSQASTLSVGDFETETTKVSVYPNPMTTQATLSFNVNQSETVQFVMYDQLGKQVHHRTFNAVSGKNSITINRENLSSGLYFCKIVSNQYEFNPLKLIIN